MRITFGDVVDAVIKREGGLVNDSSDKGGLTKYGISQRAFPKEDISSINEAKAKKLYSILLQNMPMQNLFYAKTAFDYLLNYQMQDIIDPGYHSRQYSRMQKETLQQYRNTPTGIFQ